MAAVAPPRIHGQGAAETAWRASPWLRALLERHATELLRGRERVLLLSPHPDDETLACGGLLRAATRAGVGIHLLAVTDGEACYPGDARWTPARLREERPREVERALATLDVRADIERLGLPDGEVAAHARALGDALRERVRPGDLVLAPWEHDGHPDHDAVGRAALATPCPGARLLRYPVWAWHWLDATAPAAPFAAVRVPLAAGTRARKRCAIACFASQTGGTLRPRRPDPVLPQRVLDRFRRPFEVYLT